MDCGRACAAVVLTMLKPWQGSVLKVSIGVDNIGSEAVKSKRDWDDRAGEVRCPVRLGA